MHTQLLIPSLLLTQSHLQRALLPGVDDADRLALAVSVESAQRTIAAADDAAAAAVVISNGDVAGMAAAVHTLCFALLLADDSGASVSSATVACKVSSCCAFT
jgi:hypothetical protein